MSQPFDPARYPHRLNLGCGLDRRPGYLNVDLHEFHQPDLVADVLDLGMLPAGHYEEILAQDILEHLHRTRTRAALAEWNRLLAPGGILRLRVPSVLHLAELLRRDENQSLQRQEELIQCLFGTQCYEGDYHHTAFTELLLRSYLEEAGFTPRSVEILHEWLFDVVAVKTGAVRRDPLLSLEDPLDFLTEAYRKLLLREPDEEGLAFYRAKLESGEMTREMIVESLSRSEEGRRARE